MAAILETLDSDDSESDDDGKVQLGYALPYKNRLLFENKNWNNWDGGVAGGAPIWLDGPPANACDACGTDSQFLCQIYAPLDKPASAFHRAIYVFCCGKCAEKDPGTAAAVVEQRLPRENGRYAAETPPESEDEDDGPSPTASRGLPRHEIVVEPEPSDKIAGAEPSPEARIADAAVAVDELKITGTTDPSVVTFLARIAREPSQVLRYDRGGRPLWHGSHGRPPKSWPPRCPCGAVREFEFQVMPQLLHYFRMESQAGLDLDFATILVATCAEGCGAAGAAWVQPPAPDDAAAAEAKKKPRRKKKKKPPAAVEAPLPRVAEAATELDEIDAAAADVLGRAEELEQYYSAEIDGMPMNVLDLMPPS